MALSPCLAAIIPLVLLLSRAPPGADTRTTGHLCGKDLVNALYIVCGDRGFFYDPTKLKRDTGALAGKALIGPPDLKRGIVEQCCRKRCTIYDLENYCN
uniref:Insulin n=1 Tax=Eptatretus burgeri TaxID=7764 RepID=A0A8C4R1Z5_EPTBU